METWTPIHVYMSQLPYTLIAHIRSACDKCTKWPYLVYQPFVMKYRVVAEEFRQRDLHGLSNLPLSEYSIQPVRSMALN